MTDWKALCEELADALASHYPGHVDNDELIKRARAALAETVAVPDRLPELRGMFERILCVARSSDQKPVGNIELADRLIKAVVSWAASGAALAGEPVGEEPTDEELFRIASDCAALYIADDRDYDNCSEVVAAMRGAIAADRSRFGRQPAPPPAGEVEELVAWLRSTGEGQPCLSDEGYARLTRAANLLEQYCFAPPTEASAAPTWPANFTRSMRAAQARRLCIAANLPESSPIVNRITREAANGLSLKDVVDLIASESSEPGVSAPVSATQHHPTPVPVAERPWEREGWCDEQGRCWWGRQETDDWSSDWTLSTYEDTQEFCTYNPMTVCLPANALPLPAAEVQ